VVAFCSFALAQSLSPAADVHSEARDGRIEVHLDADGLAPRPIEELTGATIARHYALAWQNLAQALESSNADGLGDEFTGFAKEHLTKRIAEQKQTGVRTRIVDHGHRLKAIFYSSDGAAMQLLDLTQLEIQTFDGSKLLDTQNAPHTYIVVLTPGADRWYIRDLEEVSAKP
jgi:non-ribosomal peptide synthetase component F